MNQYEAFYKDKRLTVEAATSYAAQLKAAELFKARKSYEVNVVLAAKDGVPVVHSTASLG